MFQQGFDMDVLEVEPGETFTIEEETKGQIDCSEIQYKFIRKKQEWETEDDLWLEDYENEDNIELTPGEYMLLEDGITIEEI